MHKSHHILIVDDEPELTGMTKEYLEAKGFVVMMRHNAAAGLAAFKQGAFDICVLDVKMPFKDGFSLAMEIRALDAHVPFIFLTGQTDKDDRIKGLLLGADDYVTKPYSMQELYLRLNVVLKRSGHRQGAQTAIHKIGAFTYDANSRALTRGDHISRLSEMEGQLLLLFCESPDRTVLRDQALREIWNDDTHVKSRSLNVYITKLRNHLKDGDNIEIINIHGTGYRLIVKQGD